MLLRPEKTDNFAGFVTPVIIMKRMTRLYLPIVFPLVDLEVLEEISPVLEDALQGVEHERFTKRCGREMKN